MYKVPRQSSNDSFNPFLSMLQLDGIEETEPLCMSSDLCEHRRISFDSLVEYIVGDDILATIASVRTGTTLAFCQVPVDRLTCTGSPTASLCCERKERCLVPGTFHCFTLRWFRPYSLFCSVCCAKCRRAPHANTHRATATAHTHTHTHTHTLTSSTQTSGMPECLQQSLFQ